MCNDIHNITLKLIIKKKLQKNLFLSEMKVK